MSEIVFWSLIASPHMMSLATSLASQGYKVTYVAAETISSERASQGWVMPDIKGVVLVLINRPTDAQTLAKSYSSNVIHLIQGLRGHGYISDIVNIVVSKNLRWGAIMETIDERYYLGLLKRLVYSLKLYNPDYRPDFILAIGSTTPLWLAAQGFSKEYIFPFAYFLPQLSATNDVKILNRNIYKIGYIGSLITRKRVDILIHALAILHNKNFELYIVGNGPLQRKLKHLALNKLPADRVHFVGTVSMTEAKSIAASVDCLVLPSDFDGWGAVISEALIAGTPAICSDACGAQGVVKASGVGGIFQRGNVNDLMNILSDSIDSGPLSSAQRKTISEWARCLDSEAGAIYLSKIITSIYEGNQRPHIPWE